MSTVAYRNLLFSTHSVQASGQNEIAKIRLDIQRLTLDLLNPSLLILSHLFFIRLRKLVDTTISEGFSQRHIMKWNIWSNRRQGERRSEPDDAGGRRKAQRREDDRRNFVRLYYPLTAAPKVLNANFRILDLSENGIKLLCKNKCEECADPISLKSVLNLKIQFHDGQISDIVVKINRCEAIPNGKDKNYAGSITKGMTAERIDKEEAYLLSLSPQSDLEEEE